MFENHPMTSSITYKKCIQLQDIYCAGGIDSYQISDIIWKADKAKCTIKIWNHMEILGSVCIPFRHILMHANDDTLQSSFRNLQNWWKITTYGAVVYSNTYKLGPLVSIRSKWSKPKIFSSTWSLHSIWLGWKFRFHHLKCQQIE